MCYEKKVIVMGINMQKKKKVNVSRKKNFAVTKTKNILMMSKSVINVKEIVMLTLTRRKVIKRHCDVSRKKKAMAQT